MTQPDGPPADPAGTGPAGESPLDNLLLPASRVRTADADVHTDADADGRVELPLGDGNLGNWFDEVEMEGPTAREQLRRSETRAEQRKRSAPDQNLVAAARLQVYAIAAMAAAVAMLAPGEPTGLMGWDPILRAGFAFGITVACSHARRWTWMVLSGAAAAASRDLGPALLAWSSLALSFAAAVFDFRRRRVGAVVGALAVNALLRLAPIGPHGFTALLVAVVVAPVLVSAYRVQRRRLQKRIRLAVGITAGVSLVAVVLLGLAGALGVGHVQRAQDAARQGLELAKAGKQDESAVQFTIADDEFQTAEGWLRSVLVQPSRLVPIVGYQTDALGRMASLGSNLASTAERVTTEADYRRITVTDGRIDVAEIEAWGPALEEVETALVAAESAAAEIDTSWLAPPILERYSDLDIQVTDALAETRIAGDAVAVAPDLLGANGVRHYFIAFTTPAESRGLGGFMGNWAVLQANDGRLDIVADGRSSDLAPKRGEPERVLHAPDDYIRRYGALNPDSQFRDITLSPDFPSVAQAMTSVYPQTVKGIPIDGALAVDPYAIAAMLEITGPVTVKGLPFKLDSTNAAEYLLREQYLAFDPAEENAERKDILEAASRTTFEAFISQKTFRPSQLAEVLGPVVAERRLLAYSVVPSEEALITEVGLDGRFPEPTDHDFFSLVTQNAGNNKMDIYLHRSIDYDVVVDPATGELDATATIRLRNDAPSSGLPKYVIGNRPSSGQPDGVNWMWFNFYTPHGLQEATYDGQPMSVGEQREFGQRVYQTYLPVPSGGETVIVLRLSGSIEPGARYDVDWFQQPLVNTDHVSVTVRSREGGDDGAAPTTTEPVTVTRDERTDQQVTVDLVG
jgi:hypothetical protein